MNLKGSILAATLLALACAFAAPASAQILNGNFSTDYTADSNNITDWAVTFAAPGSDIFLTSEFGDDVVAFSALDPGYYDTISQTLATQPDKEYTLSFELNNAESTPSADFQALWNNTTVVDVSGTDPADLTGLTTYTFEEYATGQTTTLSFKGYQSPSFYYLTDVQVTLNNPQPVPEGGSTPLYLLLSGSICAAAILLRARRRSASLPSA